jgi:phage-related protein
MLCSLVVTTACSADECDFPSDDEILATGESETVQVRVNEGRIGQVQAAGWTYSVYPWEMRGSSQEKQWKHPKVSLSDGTYAGTVTALEDDDLVLTGVAADKFLLKPVGCY